MEHSDVYNSLSATADAAIAAGAVALLLAGF
jgi:hypothetical protein